MKRAQPPRTAAELLADARAVLVDPREATILVADALGVSREMLYAHPERKISPREAAQALALVTRRAEGEPVAYLTGMREFHGLALMVTPAVLIPRPETELLVDIALENLKGLDAPVVADIGTGSGAIALAIARARPDARIVASDRSKAALDVAAGNAGRLAIANVSFVRTDWLAPFAPRSFDLVVSNPPYVAAGDPHLSQGDLRFEPSAALVAGADGLAAIRRLIPAAALGLKPGGTLILEHGAEQQPTIRALFTENGYTNIETHRDLANLPRAVTGVSPKPKASVV